MKKKDRMIYYTNFQHFGGPRDTMKMLFLRFEVKIILEGITQGWEII